MYIRNGTLWIDGVVINAQWVLFRQTFDIDFRPPEIFTIHLHTAECSILLKFRVTLWRFSSTVTIFDLSSTCVPR